MTALATPLRGRHAFVTGASRGIGAAIAAQLEQAGAAVTRTARHASDDVLACDVSDASQVADSMALAEQRHGAIDILINNAGIGSSARFLDSDTAMLDEMLAVNLKGAWHCSQRALPGMVAGGWGRIVNVASLAGLRGFAYIGAYCASKHALVGLTRALATEFAGTDDIAIAAICPGYADTRMLAETVDNIVARTGLSKTQAHARVAALNPGGRILAPAEIAACAVELCIAESGRSNGQIISLPPSEAPP